jgi:negative regulator of flagellin synthesis FlgM|tara:strand:- start:3415 stop:3747 length:333 start_codon:yes stop_codon:yes gene_type:complete
MAINIRNISSGQPPTNDSVKSAANQQNRLENANVQRTQAEVSKQQPSTSDTVVLSKDSQSLQSVQKQLKEQPEINDKRVREIKEALAQGKLKVDPERIAARMVDIERALS